MATKNRFWWGTAVLSVSALMLTACGDDGDNGDDDANGDDTAAEETTEETTEDEEADEDEADVVEDDADEDAEEPVEEEEDAAEDEGGDGPFAGDVLSEEEISELLLTEDEFPVEFEDFMAEESLSEAMSMPDEGLINDCEEYAEYFQNPAAFEDSHTDVEVTGAANMGMYGDQADPSVLQVAIMSYSDPAAASDFDLIQECEGETFTNEEAGMSIDMTFEYLTYEDWEGLSMVMSMEGMEQAIDILVYEDGNTEIMALTMGEGSEYLEELADLQLDKYESAS
ncbi:hypothetical protein HGQ17_14320 [Nesterenkonia sp. MY13]|uniref:Uncharacterized protein n=1 Tax=Nesterenkonia sedimenti TaxID=1463632 RepID=A0A7X8YFB7_9MICC|nr:hypothetical protein [Nesterenkonia sedimenti]NLS11152.1 hypothetical protein [Nesterenkonia sedimenti]